jgi:hypothetical protein
VDQPAIAVLGLDAPLPGGADESLHLAEFARTCLAEALLLGNLANP